MFSFLQSTPYVILLHSKYIAIRLEYDEEKQSSIYIHISNNKSMIEVLPSRISINAEFKAF